MYAAASAKSNISFMNTTCNQPVQKYAFRSLLLPQPQQSATTSVPKHAHTKADITASKAECKPGYDPSILFSGLTQLQKGSPVTRLQTLQALIQLTQVNNPKLRASQRSSHSMGSRNRGVFFGK